LFIDKGANVNHYGVERNEITSFDLPGMISAGCVDSRTESDGVATLDVSVYEFMGYGGMNGIATAAKAAGLNAKFYRDEHGMAFATITIQTSDEHKFFRTSARSY
jgi:hypothetical protein